MNELHVDWHDFILQEVAETRSTRRQVAHTYSYLIELGHQEWHDVNAAIKKRWGVSGLQGIKKAAWKIVKPHRVEP